MVFKIDEKIFFGKWQKRLVLDKKNYQQNLTTINFIRIQNMELHTFFQLVYLLPE